jgi:thiol-disulfide isomerase/thioredoxin
MHDQSRLTEALASLDALARLDHDNEELWLFRKAALLMRQGEIEAGKEGFATFLGKYPKSARRLSAQAMFADPTVALRPIVPVATLYDRNGRELKLMNGPEFTVLDFWATYCPPCITDLPRLKKLRKEWEPKSVQLISIGMDKEEEWRAFIDKNGMDWPQVHDGPSWERAYDFELPRLPGYLIIDKRGVILRMTIDLDDIEERMATILSSKSHQTPAAKQ